MAAGSVTRALAPDADERHAQGTKPERRPTILHVMTVAQSLMLLEGQVRFMLEQGFDVVVATAPGSYAAVFTEREGVPVEPIEMTRQITPLRDLGALWRLVRLAPKIS